jgi:hypothetical protein
MKKLAVLAILMGLGLWLWTVMICNSIAPNSWLFWEILYPALCSQVLMFAVGIWVGGGEKCSKPGQ